MKVKELIEYLKRYKDDDPIKELMDKAKDEERHIHEIYHIGVWEGSNGDLWHELGTITQCTRQQAEEHAEALCDGTEFERDWYCYSSVELREIAMERNYFEEEPPDPLVELMDKAKDKAEG